MIEVDIDDPRIIALYHRYLKCYFDYFSAHPIDWHGLSDQLFTDEFKTYDDYIAYCIKFNCVKQFIGFYSNGFPRNVSTSSALHIIPVDTALSFEELDLALTALGY